MGCTFGGQAWRGPFGGGGGPSGEAFQGLRLPLGLREWDAQRYCPNAPLTSVCGGLRADAMTYTITDMRVRNPTVGGARRDFGRRADVRYGTER